MNFKKKPAEKPLQKTLGIKEDFSYVKGETNLSFTLRLEDKLVRDFRECLVQALKDLDEVLVNLDK